MTIQMQLTATCGTARATSIKLRHGEVRTPMFMPVGTQAAVKACPVDCLTEIGCEIILANTYHLMLRPQVDVISKLGGLHKFMSWSKPILTDSGGFQVMSLAGLRQINDEGIKFRSHIDGKHLYLDPEIATEAQVNLGVDIAMVLDQCINSTAAESEIWQAMERSLRWAERCHRVFPQRQGHGLFGIVQGGTIAKCRSTSANALIAMNFAGYAIGGLAVGEQPEVRQEIIRQMDAMLPSTKPRYLMGVGKPPDIVNAIAAGVDLFDCVLPTRNARNGQAFTHHGQLNLRNAKHRADVNPIDRNCNCQTCRSHSRAYLHHLVKSGNLLAAVLLTRHNLAFYLNLVQQARAAIINQTFPNWSKAFLHCYAVGE